MKYKLNSKQKKIFGYHIPLLSTEQYMYVTKKEFKMVTVILTLYFVLSCRSLNNEPEYNLIWK